MGWSCHPQQMTCILSLRCLLKLPLEGLYSSRIKKKSKAEHIHFCYGCDLEITPWLTLHWSQLDHMALKRKMGCVISTGDPSPGALNISLVQHITFRMWRTLKGLRVYATCKIVSFPDSLIVVLVTQSCPTLCNPHGLQPARVLCPWDSPGKNTVGFPFPSPEDLPNPGIESGCPALQADSLPSELQGSPVHSLTGSGKGHGGEQPADHEQSGTTVLQGPRASPPASQVTSPPISFQDNVMGLDGWMRT